MQEIDLRQPSTAELKGHRHESGGTSRTWGFKKHGHSNLSDESGHTAVGYDS